MQGGGQFPSNHSMPGMDYVQQRARDEMESARRAGRTGRRRPRHRQRFGWLHLGKRRERPSTVHRHAASTVSPTAVSPSTDSNEEHGD